MESIIPGTEKGICYICERRGHTEKGRRQARAYGMALQRVSQCTTRQRAIRQGARADSASGIRETPQS